MVKCKTHIKKKRKLFNLSFGFKNRIFFEKAVGLMSLLIRQSNRSYEEKLRSSFFFLISVTVMLAAFGMFNVRFFSWISSDFSDNTMLITWISILVALSLNTLNNVLFIIIKSFELFLFIFVMIAGFFMILVHYLSGLGFNSASIICIYLGIFITAIVQSKFFVIYTIFIFGVVLSINAYEIITIPEINDLRTAYVMSTAGNLIVWILIGIYCYLIDKNRKKNEDLLKNTAQAISSLNFSSESIQELINKKPEFCTKMMLLLKQVLKIISIYKNFLPNSILQKNFHGCDQKREDNKFSSSACSSSVITESSDNLSDYNNNEEDKKKPNNQLRYAREDLLKIELKKEEISMICISFPFLSKQLVTELENKKPSKIDLKKLTDLHSAYIQIINQIIKQAGGMLTHFNAGKAFAVFNSRLCKLSYKHSEIAINSAFKILKEKEKLAKQFSLLCKDPSELYFLICISKDSSLVGNIGSENFRQLNLISNQLDSFIDIALRFANSEGYKNEIFINDEARNETKFKFEHKLVLFEEKEIFRVVSKDAANENENKEWMYSINKYLESQEEDQFLNFEKAWKFYLENKFEKAKEFLKEYLLHQKQPSESELIDNSILQRKIEKEFQIIKQTQTKNGIL